MAMDWQPKEKQNEQEVAYTDKQRKAARNITRYLCQKEIYGLPEADILKFITSSRSHFINAILKGICKKRIKFKKLPDPVKIDGIKRFTTGYELPSDKERQEVIKKTIDNKLIQNRPVAIEFCNEAVTSVKHKAKYNEYGEWVCEKNGQHAAVIVGSKKNIFGQCSYLVRDSFCSQYEKPKGQMKRTGVCRNGQYWISSDRLLKNTRAAIYLNY